ncbi:hypothetical protein B447_14834 [Thauera sp. 27]|uniref:hypothetical protein n=1 Tax=Thauera sp. 27 TaxID=305700 RepID=UPI0002CE46F7|nr:hypothetical protein [Thauera sp. 27]ENO77998.1 hypothetical protein B447_14834 [Thauera sp. 27]
MSETRPIGRWLDTVTARNTRTGELVWLPAATGGLKTHVATMVGREFAVVRPLQLGHKRQFNVRITGYVWFPETFPEGSPAKVMGVQESAVTGFPTIAKAKAAVAEAHRLLESHLQHHTE